VDTLEIIEKIARIPSFTSFEERMHPFLFGYFDALRIPGLEIIPVPDNNLVVRIPGKRKGRIIALSAHLDKIDHFGQPEKPALDFRNDGSKLTGLLDDAAGIGIILGLMQQYHTHEFFDIYLLFSECEEGISLRKNREHLKGNADGLTAMIGSERISRYLIQNDIAPDIVITVDVTPKFEGSEGIAVYDTFWAGKNFKPPEALLDKTRSVTDYFRRRDVNILFSHNTNDYINYGMLLNNHFNQQGREIVSIAIEPAVFPYHSHDESIYISDIRKIEELLLNLLTRYIV